MTEENLSLGKKQIVELAAQQIELYRRQPLELVSHYNREVNALNGYRGRQLLELLQNADDAGTEPEQDCTLLLNISRERLIVANTGEPFSQKGLTSLVISDCSPKQLDRNKFIGYKGLGFRSVLTWTDKPLISSGCYDVVFDRAKAVEVVQKLASELPEVNDVITAFHNSTQHWPAAAMRSPSVALETNQWLRKARVYREKGYDTIMILPLPIGAKGDSIYGEMLEQLKTLETKSLLFCDHLTLIKIRGDFERTWRILREKHNTTHSTIAVQLDNDPDELWQVFSRRDKIPASIEDDSSYGPREYEVAVAIPEKLTDDPEGNLCVYFPTHEQLPCNLVMHATLETTDDRKRLVDHTSNREVLRQLAYHVAKVVEEASSTADQPRALELLGGIENSDPELKSLGFIETLVEQCSKKAIFPRIDQTVKPSKEVRQAPHPAWLDEFSSDLFPEVLAIDSEKKLTGLLSLFGLSWYDAASLKDRLKRQLSGESRAVAGEKLGHLLATDQLKEIHADRLLIGDDGAFIEEGPCFFMPTEKLPAFPPWASNIHLVDEEFQNGLLRGSESLGLRFLAAKVKKYEGEVEEYRFETVARALIEQVERGIEGDSAAQRHRWSELLRWLYEASSGSRQALPQLGIKVVTMQGTLKRASLCYLGESYPRAQIIWHLYSMFGEDEFVGTASENGLDEIAEEDINKAQDFLLDLGVKVVPRMAQLSYGVDYKKFLESVIDSIGYPRTVRGQLCETPKDLRTQFREYGISNMMLPDRWMRLLKEGDSVAVAAYLLSAGGGVISEEIDSQARFEAKVGAEIKRWSDPSISIPNAMLFFLRETDWIPGNDGNRHRPSGIMLSNQGARMLHGIYSKYAINTKDNLLLAYGGRPTLESLLTRLGAVSSLETLNGQSLYELLLSLQERDPNGVIAPGIYRTLIDSSVRPDDCPQRDAFFERGKMWGQYQGLKSYIPISQLHYNANLSVTKPVESHIALVDIPPRKNSSTIKEIFGIAPLTSKEIEITFIPEGTTYDPSSEDANRHLHIAIPYIYALRLYNNMDANFRELNLLRKANLRVCTRVEVSAKLPGGIIESIIFDEPGHSIVIDSALFIVGEFRESGPGFLTFWLSVAELVAQLLGIDVADEVGGILRCHTTSEMQEVLQARLGSVADQKLKDAKDRFEKSYKDVNEEQDLPIPPPKPAGLPGQPTGSIEQPVVGAPPTTGADDSNKPVGTMTGFLPITGPADRPAKKRKIVITASGDGGKRGRGPQATEDITFLVVEAFEKELGRFTLPVSHLRGADAFGCDILSFASESIRDNAKIEQLAKRSDILRYVEVKGRSSRTGEIELPENEYKAAQRETIRYFIYRVYVDPNRDRHYEVAVLGDPLNSKAVRNVTRFNLAEGSGSKWFKCSEVENDG